MLKKAFSKLDPKYIKICAYASCTLIITLIVITLLYLSGSFWSKTWSMFTSVLRPIVMGIIITYLLLPVVRKFEEGFKVRGIIKFAHPAAVLCGIVLMLAVISLFIGVVIFTLVQSVGTIDIQGFRDFFAYLQRDFSSFMAILEEKLNNITSLPIGNIGSIVTSIVEGIKRMGSGLLFGIIFSVYFLLDGSNIARYWKRFYHLTAGTKADAKLRRFADDANRVFSGYIRGQFMDASIIGVLTSIGLLIGGIPHAIVIGILTGFGNLIPYVGPVVGYCTLAIVCITAAAWDKLIIGAVLLAAILFIDGNVINPKLLSNSVMIHPLLVIAALIGGGALGGFVGMIVAVPTAALIKVQLDRYLDEREAVLKAEGMAISEDIGTPEEPEHAD